jgi:hypothetical protein
MLIRYCAIIRRSEIAQRRSLDYEFSVNSLLVAGGMIPGNRKNIYSGGKEGKKIADCTGILPLKRWENRGRILHRRKICGGL